DGGLADEQTGDRARGNPPPSRSAGPRTGRVADGEKGRLQLSTAPADAAGTASCAALPPLEPQLAQLLLVGFPGTPAGPVSRRPADQVRRHGLATGRDLAALGVTADLAPVLDVTGARWDGVIGDRSFGADPATASRAAVAYLHGLAAGGVAPVGKHFPGHGAST